MIGSSALPVNAGIGDTFESGGSTCVQTYKFAKRLSGESFGNPLYDEVCVSANGTVFMTWAMSKSGELGKDYFSSDRIRNYVKGGPGELILYQCNARLGNSGEYECSNPVVKVLYTAK